MSEEQRITSKLDAGDAEQVAQDTAFEPGRDEKEDKDPPRHFCRGCGKATDDWYRCIDCRLDIEAVGGRPVTCWCGVRLAFSAGRGLYCPRGCPSRVPWRVTNKGGKVVVVDADNNTVCVMFYERKAANAEHIVDAIRVSHDLGHLEELARKELEKPEQEEQP